MKEGWYGWRRVPAKRNARNNADATNTQTHTRIKFTEFRWRANEKNAYARRGAQLELLYAVGFRNDDSHHRTSSMKAVFGMCFVVSKIPKWLHKAARRAPLTARASVTR